MFRRTLLVLVCGCVLSCAVGCAPRVELTPQVAMSLVDLRHELAGGKMQLETVAVSLADLKQNPRLNTERQIQLLHREMETFEQRVQRIRDINTDVQAQSDRYFKAWADEMAAIKNPEIAAAGRDREQRSRAVLETIRAKLDELRQTVSPFVSDLRDMDRYLQRDQTAQAVEALRPVMQRTLDSKASAMRKVDEVIADIDRATSGVQ